MKKQIFSTLIMLTSIFSYSFSQNLVPNPSFEDTVACPIGLGHINDAVGWSAYRFSPDYFNVCASQASSASVPSNLGGYQFPRNGNAYAGFAIGFGGYRECLGIQLSQSLNVGETYYVSFYVSRGAAQNLNRAANKIGVRLSTVSYSTVNPVPVDNHSQVYTDSVITDSLNWVRITGSFVADSTYSYLGIGNFFVDSLITYIQYDSIHFQAYYYLDDIVLSADSNCCPENIDNKTDDASISVVPNPARDWIIIQVREIKTISIYDLLGNI